MQQHQAVVGGEGRELVGRGDEGQLGQLRDASRAPHRVLRVGVEPGSHRGPAQRQLVYLGQDGLHAGAGVIELGDVAGELLAQGHGRRVLEVGAADLDHLGEGLRLGVHRVAQPAQAGQQVVHHLLGRRDVHGRGERVVGGLAAVDVIVGVNRRLAAQLAARKLDGSVGDHLVGVHVGLGPAAGLPHEQREVIVELALDDLVRRLADEPDRLGRKHLQIPVGERGRLLEQAQGADHRAWKVVVTDAEVVQRTLGLRPPVAVGWDLDGSHAVGLGPVSSIRLAHGGREASSPWWNSHDARRLGMRSSRRGTNASAGRPSSWMRPSTPTRGSTSTYGPAHSDRAAREHSAVSRRRNVGWGSLRRASARRCLESS